MTTRKAPESKTCATQFTVQDKPFKVEAKNLAKGFCSYMTILGTYSHQKKVTFRIGKDNLNNAVDVKAAIKTYLRGHNAVWGSSGSEDGISSEDGSVTILEFINNFSFQFEHPWGLPRMATVPPTLVCEARISHSHHMPSYRTLHASLRPVPLVLRHSS
jgi:hypothetical protein